MKKIALPIGILIFFSMSYSQPKVEFGIKTTRFMMEDILMFYGGTWNIDVLYEYYWGVSGELLIGFTKNLYIRFEMFGIKKFDRGGAGINVLSDLNADLIFVLPIGRSFSPLVYCGFSYGRFWDMPMNDCRGIDPAYELRVGLGAQYQLQKKIKYFWKQKYIPNINLSTGEFHRKIWCTVSMVMRLVSIVLTLGRD